MTKQIKPNLCIIVAIILISQCPKNISAEPLPTPTESGRYFKSETSETTQEDRLFKRMQKRIMFRDGKYYPIEIPVYEFRKLNEDQKHAKELSDKTIAKKYPTMLIEQPSPEDPGEVLDFEMPNGESIKGCHYDKAMSFPSFCEDSEEKVFFTAGKDPQSILDNLMLEQGITSKYNIVPNDYNPSPDLNSLPFPIAKYPSEELKRLSEEYKRALNADNAEKK